MPDSPLQTRSDLVASSALRYQVAASRYGQHVSNRMATALAEMQKELIGRVAQMPESWSRDRLEQMIAELGAILDGGFNRLNARLTDELRQFAQVSADAQLNALDAALRGQPWPAGSLREPPTLGNPIQMTLAAPAPEAVWAAVTAQPFVGTFLTDSWQKLNDLARERIETGVRQGFMQGETLQQVINRIRGTKDQAGAMELTRRNAETWARTAVNHISNQAREAVYDENDDIVTGVVWVATLDHRVCIFCGGTDGKVFPVDRPHPRPPAHFSCLPGDALITSCGRIAAASKRWFDGDMIIADTAAGHKLTCTPNHPILTNGGWVPAQRLKVGDRVFRIGLERENGVTCIQDIVEELLCSSQAATTVMSFTDEDFHGDARDGEIGIVGFYRSGAWHGDIDQTLAGNILGGDFGDVAHDKILSIHHRAFSGWVYNLETEQGFYATDTIITHNCRCVLAPALKSYGEIMGTGPSERVAGTRASQFGEVPGNWTYNDWLKAQDKNFIASVVGKRRVQDFLDGKFETSMFVPDGQAMSLEKLTKIFTKEKPLVPGFPI